MSASTLDFSGAPLRILLVGSYAPWLVNFRGPLIAALIARGHEVHAAAPDIDRPTREALDAMGAIVHETPMERQGTSILADLRYFRVLKRLVRQVRPGLVITYTIKPNIWGAFAAAAAGVPSVAMVTGLGIAFTDTAGGASVRTRLVRWAARALYRRATRHNRLVVFQNPDDRDEFIATRCLADPAKARLTNGSGVDLVHFAPSCLPGAPAFLMIARILGAKGIREYAEAAIELRRTHPDVPCRLVGFFDEGPDAIGRDEMEGWVARGLEYLGKSDDVRPHLAACSVYVLPSYYREGTPRSVLEAMATGRPILTTDAPGCRETVVDGVNGYLLPVRDSAALVEKMRYLLDNPQIVRSMATESLRIAREKYDVDKVNKTLIRDLGLDGRAGIGTAND